MRTRLAAAWDRFWFSPVDPVIVATFRVALGLYLLALLVSLAPNWTLYHGPDGTMSFGDPLIQDRPQDSWSVMVWTAGVVPVGAYWVAMVVAALALTVGWHARVAAVVLFILHTSAVHNSPSTGNGEDGVLRYLLFLSCFVPFDVDSTARPGAERWPLRMIQVTTCLLYVFTQTNKLAWEELWRNGQVMYLLSHSEVWGRFPWPLPDLFRHQWVTAAATWGSLAVEIGFPVLVWIPALRLPMVVLLGLLHVVIAICITGASFFNVVMPVCLTTFLTGEDLTRLRSACSRTPP